MHSVTFENHTGAAIYLVLDRSQHVTIYPKLNAIVKTRGTATFHTCIEAATVGRQPFRVSIHRAEWLLNNMDALPRKKNLRHIVRERHAWMLAFLGRIDDIYYVPDEFFSEPRCIVSDLWQIPKPS